MTETTALGAAVAAGAAEGIALWDIKSKNESSDVTIFQPKLDTSGKNVLQNFQTVCFILLHARSFIYLMHLLPKMISKNLLQQVCALLLLYLGCLILSI